MPITTLTTAGAIVSMFGTAISAMKGVHEVARARTGAQDAEAEAAAQAKRVEQMLLTAALLDADANLAVLEAVSRTAAGLDRESVGPIAQGLQTDALAALLLQWSPKDTGSGASPQGSDDTSRRALPLDGGVPALLGEIRYIIGRVHALRVVCSASPDALRAIRYGVRLKNLREAHGRVVMALAAQVKMLE